MAPKKRSSNFHLPPRVYRKHNAYYFVDLNNKWHRLGKTFPEAMREYGKIYEGIFSSPTFGSVCDKYLLEVSPEKAPTTYHREITAIKAIKTGLQHLFPTDLSPVLIYKYMDERRQVVSPATVNKEKAILTSICHAAVRWGILPSNPCLEVKSLKNKTTSLPRYVTDEEFQSFYNFTTPIIRIFLAFAILTGLRLGDLLNLKFTDCKEEGLTLTISKTSMPIVFEWTDNLKQAVEVAKKIREPIRGMYLISNQKGQKYTTRGFQRLWEESMKKYTKEKEGKSTFRIHDIRRKVATDANKAKGREYARQLLGHHSQNMTARYIGGTQTVAALEPNILLDK